MCYYVNYSEEFPVNKTNKILSALVFWLALWWVLALLTASELLLPSPGATVRRLLTLLPTGAFWLTVGTTLLRILCGAVAGIVLGTLLAVLTCRFSLLRALFDPLLTVIKSTPVVSVIILLLVWLGRGILPSVVVVLMVVPPVWSNVSAGIEGTDPLLLQMAKTYRFPRARVLRRIYLPSVLPHFLAACRSALGLAWKSGVAAEVLTVPAISIGKKLADSKSYMETLDLFAWTLVVILCSLAIEKLLMAAMERIGGGKR